MAKPVTPQTSIDRLVKKNELGQPFRLIDHQREVLRLVFDFDKDARRCRLMELMRAYLSKRSAGDGPMSTTGAISEPFGTMSPTRSRF